MAGSGTAHLRPADQTLLRIENLVVEFPIGRTGLKVNAVSSVSIDVLPGETLGLVGESGCGKSTMGKAVMQLVKATSGSVLFESRELTRLSGEELRETRPKLQMIFQDPISSLNPRRRVRDIVREGLDIWKIGNKESRVRRVNEVLDTVGIDSSVAGPKRPHEFSGGQCQRISIARAVATEPKLIICDEPVSALDVSVQAQILNLLEDMKRKYGLTLIFIAHDLAVVKNVSDKVAVMYLGKLCEFAQPDVLYANPAHPYTAALLSAIPEPDPDSHLKERSGVGGEIPSPVSPPSGCRFRTRCPGAQEICAAQEPMIREIRPAHFVACHFPLGDITVTETTAAIPTVPQATMPPPVTPTGVTAPPVVPAWTPAPAPVPAAPIAPPPPPVPAAPAPAAPIAPPPPPTPPPAPVTVVPGDAWLDATVAGARIAEVRPRDVDWTPEPAPLPVVAAPPVPAAPTGAAAPAPIAPFAEAPVEPPTPEPPTPEPPTPPVDRTALDTLLPDRSKGGSVNPGK